MDVSFLANSEHSDEPPRLSPAPEQDLHNEPFEDVAAGG